MSIKEAVWVHGTGFEVEFPQLLDSYVRRGWGIHYWGKENTFNWFHIPITTPVIINDARPNLVKAFVLFKTTGWTKVKNIHLYDGIQKVLDLNGLSLSGNNESSLTASNTFTLNPPKTIRYGLGISVGVEFGPHDSSGYPEILFTTAGADFA
ncbi:MAG TPA: DUF6623 family protein [Clostridia bacterium]